MVGRPILFSGPMVRALLAGTKTQTRRVLKPSHLRFFNGDDKPYRPDIEYLARALLDATDFRCIDRDVWTWRGKAFDYQDGPQTLWLAYLNFVVGDRLWVRETWQVPALCDPQYRATSTERIGHWDPAVGPWKPGIHMPRWASRLTLTVTGVRVQRLQDITEEDAKAEGVALAIAGQGDDGTIRIRTHRTGFVGVWQEINGNWLDNPWVVALTFTVERRNIDAEVPA